MSPRAHAQEEAAALTNLKAAGVDYAGSYMDTGYTAGELRDMLSGGDTSLSQTAEGAALSVQVTTQTVLTTM